MRYSATKLRAHQNYRGSTIYIKNISKFVPILSWILDFYKIGTNRALCHYSDVHSRSSDRSVGELKARRKIITKTTDFSTKTRGECLFWIWTSVWIQNKNLATINSSKIFEKPIKILMRFYPAPFPNTPWSCYGDEGIKSILSAGSIPCGKVAGFMSTVVTASWADSALNHPALFLCLSRKFYKQNKNPKLHQPRE